MNNYRCRTTKPIVNGTGWFDIEACSPTEAAQNLVWNNPHLPTYTYFHETGPDTRETITFTLVEVEGFGEFIVRNYRAGLYRRGGIKVKSGSGYLKQIAHDLCFDGDPKELLDPGWDLEEEDWV